MTVLAILLTFSRIAAATFLIASGKLSRMDEAALTFGLDVGTAVGGLDKFPISSG